MKTICRIPPPIRNADISRAKQLVRKSEEKLFNLSFKYLERGQPGGAIPDYEMSYLFWVVEFFGNVNDLPVLSKDKVLSNRSSILKVLGIEQDEVTMRQVIDCTYRFINHTEKRFNLIGFFINRTLYVLRFEDLT